MSTIAEADQVLPDAKFVFDQSQAALVVIDPQNDFLSPDGAGWPVFGRSVTENNTVANLARLFEAAESGHLTVAVSPITSIPPTGNGDSAGQPSNSSTPFTCLNGLAH
jgi:nicotinamidase-related amidase